MKTFRCEQDGKRYRLREQTCGAFLPEEIIEPKLEVGDWYRTDSWSGVIIHGTEPPGQPEHCKILALLEIRKASGEIWKKVDGEWVKVN